MPVYRRYILCYVALLVTAMFSLDHTLHVKALPVETTYNTVSTVAMTTGMSTSPKSVSNAPGLSPTSPTTPTNHMSPTTGPNISAMLKNPVPPSTSAPSPTASVRPSTDASTVNSIKGPGVSGVSSTTLLPNTPMPSSSTTLSNMSNVKPAPSTPNTTKTSTSKSLPGMSSVSSVTSSPNTPKPSTLPVAVKVTASRLGSSKKLIDMCKFLLRRGFPLVPGCSEAASLSGWH